MKAIKLNLEIIVEVEINMFSLFKIVGFANNRQVRKIYFELCQLKVNIKEQL